MCPIIPKIKDIQINSNNFAIGNQFQVITVLKNEREPSQHNASSSYNAIVNIIIC